MPGLSAADRKLLAIIAGGGRLRDHRDIEGGKRLSLVDGDGAEVNPDIAAVDNLIQAGFIDSNKKFPAATYWLTESGKAAAAGIAAARHGPLNS